MKLNKKIIFFLALMSLFYCVSLMQETYAKYISSAGANTNLAIARWNILVNSTDIVNNSDFTTSIAPVFEGTTYIKNGVIAPTAEGYFDVTINGTDTDVSFTYTISLGLGSTNTVSDLKITKYVMDNVEHTVNGNITGNILYNDAVKSKTIRVYIGWDDTAATETMDNTADTAATKNGVASVDVSVNVVQMQTQIVNNGS